jgi:glutaconate CoA-transferase, subunit A
MTLDVIYDQLIGAGCARRLVFSWDGNPGVGSLHRFRDAVQQGWPVPLEVEEHSHAGMANRYVAGASGLPFAVLRGYVGTDLAGHTSSTRPITCPFTGEVLTAVPALCPDAAVVPTQRADRAGNVQLWGITGVHKEVVLASHRSLVTVEEVVDTLDPLPGAVVLPAWAVDYVAEVPGGAQPSYAQGYYERDNAWYQAWDEISRDRDRFSRWLQDEVLTAQAGYRGSPPGVTRWIVWCWLDSTGDLSSTNSTQAHCVDGEHQPTELVVSAGRVRGVSGGGREALGARPGLAPTAGSGCPRDRR